MDMKMNTIKKIISEGRSGADKAAMDAAAECVIDCDGHPKQTDRNIMNSDGLLIFSYGKTPKSFAPKKRMARLRNKPFLSVDLEMVSNPVAFIKDWLIEWDIKVLHVTGQTEKKAPGIYKDVKPIIKKILE